MLHIKKSKPSPGLNQGQKFKKYQNKISNRLQKNAENLSNKEGFTNTNFHGASNTNANSLTSQTKQIIDNNDYSQQQQMIANLRQEYQNTLQEYETLAEKMSSNVSGYISRVNPNNPYLNKTVQFTTGEICYVTNQGVAKYIPSQDILNSVNVPKNFLQLNIPWQDSYSSPGTQIPTIPPLVSGTIVEHGQSFGSEGSNIFVNQLLPKGTTATYMGCYAPSSNNDNMTFIGGAPPSSDVSIQNGTFSQPVLANNSYTNITSSSQVPGWYFEAVLLNNSTAWGYPTPYPNGNQCVSIQNKQYINTLANLNAGVSYTLTFYSCGRSCCTSPSGGNPINVQLYTNANAFISTIYQFTPPVNTWTNYTTTFTVPTTQSYKLYFSGTNVSGDRSSAIQNISLSGSSVSSGNYTYNDCMQAAAQEGYRYFALQNVNTQTSTGYCAVSNSSPAISQYGEAMVPSQLVALWSTNTSGQSGNTATLSNTGSLQVINTSGQVVFSTQGGNPSNYLGCYQDCNSGRGLPTYLGNGKTYESCQSAAQQGGYQYFGLQFTQPNGTSECWVGNDISQGMSMGKAGNCSNINGVTVGGGCSNAIYNNSSASSNYYLILQDDGNMCVRRGTSPNDEQGGIWCAMTNGKQQAANPNVVASKGKYGQNWMPSGGTLAPGDFIGSSDGKMALVMQTDGNLVLYTYQMGSNCQKMSDGNTGGGVNANAAYDIGLTTNAQNIGQLAYIDADSNLYTYPSNNVTYSNNYSTFKNSTTDGNDLQNGSSANSNINSCQTSCDNNSDCAGFVFDNTNSICYLKNNNMYPYGSGTMSGSTTSDIYIKNKIPLTPPQGVSQNTNTTDTLTFQNYVNKGDIESKYGLSKLTTVQKQQLEQLQNKLNVLSSQITTLTGKFGAGASMANNQTNKNNTGLDEYIQNIKGVNTEIKEVAVTTAGGLQNILKDSDIVVLQKNYDYLFWSILAAGTVLVSMNIVKKQ